MLHAAVAYQRPKARLNAPSAGATLPNTARTGADTSTEPNPLERRLIETAVKTARSTSERTASPFDWTDASRRTATPALPRSRPVDIGVTVEPKLAALPAPKEPDRQVDDDQPDCGLRSLLNTLREKRVQENHG